MIDPAAYGLFVVSAVVVLLIPGPAVVYIVTRSIDQGRAAGVVSALGVGLGNLVQAAAAVLGLSALLASSAVAFSLIKYVGAAYLIYLGIKRLRERDELPDDAVPKKGMKRTFTDGIVVNIFNPKVALFFLAFLPQFVDPSRGSATAQIALLGVTFALIGIVTDSCYALVTGSFSSVLRGSLRAVCIQRWISGCVYIGLGVGSALAGSSKLK